MAGQRIADANRASLAAEVDVGRDLSSQPAWRRPILEAIEDSSVARFIEPSSGFD